MIRETVYEHAEGNDTFTVTAIERWSINMIHKLKADQVDIINVNRDRSIVVRLPFEWMRIILKRALYIKPEERSLRSERMRDLKERRKANTEYIKKNCK